MSATKNPNQAIPSSPPNVTKEWALDSGETVTHEWPIGTKDDLDTKYEDLKSSAIGDNTASLRYKNAEGHASLVAKFGRQENINEDFGPDVTVIEELYSVDLIKDVRESPYFAEDLASSHPLFSSQDGKGEPMSSEVVAWVTYCVENRLSTGEITTESQYKGHAADPFEWSNWTTIMKELRYHMTRGVTSFYETGFILRRSMHGVKTSVVQATFTGINYVATNDPGFTSAMDSLLGALPSGEWLYKPPQADHLGKGRWRITQEWHYAEKWSIMYGGSFNGTT